MAKIILENCNLELLPSEDRIIFSELLKNNSSNNFQNYNILSFDISALPTVVLDNLLDNEYEFAGIFKASRKMIFNYYIQKPCSAFFSGSQNYGISDIDSDYDFMVLIDKDIRIKTDDTESYFRIFNPSSLMLSAQCGDRIAWEYLTTGESTRVAKNDSLDELKLKMLDFLGTKKIPWRSASVSYFNKWYPYFFLSAEEQPYLSISRWVKKKGWPYKLGYYILIDSFLSLQAEKNNCYKIDLSSCESIDFLIKLRHGDILFEEWMSRVIKYLPPQCSFYIDKKLPRIQ